MQGWIPDISGASGPKYLAIAAALSRDIDAGALSSGDRLPPQRVLADALGVDLTTVTRAYGEAQRLGLIEGSGRRGSFVRAKATPAPSATTSLDPGDTGMNAPPDGFGGSLAAAFRDSAASLLSSGTSAPFQYQRSGGASSVRRAGADLLGARGIPCDEDTVLVTAGGQNALHAIFSAEFSAGDRIAVGTFAYPGLLSLARRFGVSLVPIACDEHGMCPDLLAAACLAGGIRGVYNVPANDNPTTITMPVDRRQSIAAVAQAHGLLVIEDDAYGLLSAQPTPPIAAFAPERTWHVASVSKILTPGLRVAWLRAPDVARAWRLAADLHETSVMAPPLNAAVVTQWLQTGMFERLVDEVRSEARARQTIVRECLSPATFRSQEYGYHLWIATGGANAQQIAEAMRQHGLSAIPGEAFAADRLSPDVETSMRFSIGGTIGHDRLQRALTLLAALIGPDGTRKVSIV